MQASRLYLYYKVGVVTNKNRVPRAVVRKNGSPVERFYRVLKENNRYTTANLKAIRLAQRVKARAEYEAHPAR